MGFDIEPAVVLKPIAENQAHHHSLGCEDLRLTAQLRALRVFGFASAPSGPAPRLPPQRRPPPVPSAAHPAPKRPARPGSGSEVDSSARCVDVRCMCFSVACTSGYALISFRFRALAPPSPMSMISFSAAAFHAAPSVLKSWFSTGMAGLGAVGRSPVDHLREFLRLPPPTFHHELGNSGCRPWNSSTLMLSTESTSGQYLATQILDNILGWEFLSYANRVSASGAQPIQPRGEAASCPGAGAGMAEMADSSAPRARGGVRAVGNRGATRRLVVRRALSAHAARDLDVEVLGSLSVFVIHPKTSHCFIHPQFTRSNKG